MDAEVKQQQGLMRSLHVFVDALRDVKKTGDATTTDRDVVEAVRVLCNPSDDQNVPAGDLQWHSEIWRHGLVPTFQRLCACMTRLDEFEVQISKDVLMWGDREYNSSDEAVKKEEGDTINELLNITQALLHLLSLPQFQPILLPKYVVELLALLVYGEVAAEASTPVQTEFVRLREMVLRVLPLRMSMSSLRAALGQATLVANKQGVGQRFKGRCGKLLSQLLMENGGIVATIEMLLGAVEEGNTQARMQVATLICQCPSGEKPEKYVSALCTQVRDLLIAAVTPEKGPSVLRSANAVLQCIGTVLATYTAPITKLVDKEQQDGGLVRPLEEAEGEEEGDEILTICLGVVMTILEAGSAHRKESEEQQLRAMLPVLENLSHNPRPEVAELASNARAQILSRDAVDRANSVINNERGQSFEEVLWEAEQDLSSKLVPLRARGVVSLTKLVRRSHSHANDVEWMPRVHALAGVFLVQLHDAESYVFLAAVQGLAALADTHADIAIPALVKALGDSSSTLETRIKLSEALLFSAKRCGETLPKFAKLFVYAYLDCIRPPPSKRKHVERIQAEASRRVQLIQEVRGTEELDAYAEVENSEDGHESEEELLAAATLRASCLSNLAEVCALLQWGLQPFLLDVLTCVFGVLQVELELEAKHKPYLQRARVDTKEDEQHKLKAHKEEEKQQRVVAVRRGAVFVLRYLVELLGWKILELMPDQLKPLYHTLKHVVRVDQDRVVVFHANRALTALSDVMRAELFPRMEEQDAALGISSLRII
ncbi:hypothetical protein G195_007099 [Phytophthora kernoviae 00238/432]|uniref:RNA polymerase II assembly factor Rtp1 C-terminal domain-containing protein n=1 Tax=Phytophthora kernoviae 00238/432 TaxID=1284355 RepID=A0A8J4WE41_9STRA|nr:hypothetical protein G195_007099 [Phytophthora kernoviae 00238/432]